MEIADSEREEGEIIDDELEDVSDCSITSFVHLGKSVSAPERLRSVSLSSISDSELEAGTPRKIGHYISPLKANHPYTKPHRPKRKRKHGGGRRAAVLKSDSEDERFDRKTLQQLKEAVRVNASGEIHHNSLRTRLKALIAPGGEKEDADVLVVNDNDKTAEKQENGGDLTNDKELEELRLEALKSAVLKKHFERKKRKALEKEKSEKLEGGDINKENTVDNVITAESGPNNEEAKKNEVSVEEDVDIMRAMLLASMSRRITEASKTVKNSQVVQPAVNKPSNNNTQKPVKQIVKNNYYTNNNKIVNCVNNNAFKPAVPRVEPLIINLNNDSGSDMDIEEDEENDDDVTKSVTDFLSQQRAEVEAKKAEKEKAFPVLNKSVMRLLPFSQQIEYLRLKQQLQAKKVKLQKPSSQNQTVGKIAQNEMRNARNKPVMRSKFSLVKPAAVKDRIRVVKANKIERNNASSLQRTLSDMQTQKDGRLEVKGKYQELAPILKKVNQVSVERKRHENEIKRLLQELEKMQQNYNASHRNFKNLMEELMRKKEAIDKRTTVINKEVQKDPVFTTPVKVTEDLSLSQLEDNVILASSTPIATNNPPNFHQQQQKQSEAKTEKDIHEIVDPNDLNEHIMYRNKNLTETSNLPKYVSPLDKRDNDCVMADPLAMLCPFDLLGVCKDQECIYKHCS